MPVALQSVFIRDASNGWIIDLTRMPWAVTNTRAQGRTSPSANTTRAPGMMALKATESFRTRAPIAARDSRARCSQKRGMVELEGRARALTTTGDS
jgi:hypothetical protein